MILATGMFRLMFVISEVDLVQLLNFKNNDMGEQFFILQVFRSIDSGSLKGFPKDVFQAELQVCRFLD